MEKIAAAMLIVTGAFSAVTDHAGSLLAQMTTEGLPPWLAILERYGIAGICAFIAWMFIRRDTENLKRREEMHEEALTATREQTSQLTALSHRSTLAIEETSKSNFLAARRIEELTHAINDKLPCVRDQSGTAGQG